MQTRYRVSSLALVAVLGLSVLGCGQYSGLKAKKHFKDANELYKTQEWKRAAVKYENAIAADPDLTDAYFYLGNSYDNMYKPTRAGEAQNDAYLEKAVANYKIATERSKEASLRKLSVQYLVAAYGPDKLNDPDKAEPLVQQMVKMDPTDIANYFALAKLYEDAGRYDEAEAALLKAREQKPKDPNVHLQLAGYYNRQGEFLKSIAAFEERAALEPNNPEAYYTLAVFFWDKSSRDFRLKDAEKADFANRGIQAVDKALAIKNDHIDSLIYKGLLLRVQANLLKDPAKQQALIKEATALQQRAIELKKKQTAGVPSAP